MATAILTAARLRELAHYDQETGSFRWLSTGKGRNNSGAFGGYDLSGYLTAHVDGRHYKQHRLAWLYVYGEMPSGHLDHINGDPSDNRIINLRVVSITTNNQNQRRARKHSATGMLGVFPYLDGRFRAQIKVEKKAVHVGVFDTAEQAQAAYVSAKRLLHEGCTL
jgi:hypothetical protein